MVIGVVANRMPNADIRVLKVGSTEVMHIPLFQRNAVAPLNFIQASHDKNDSNWLNLTLGCWTLEAIRLINQLADEGCIAFVSAGNQRLLLNSTFNYNIAKKFIIVGSLNAHESQISVFSNHGAAVDAYAIRENMQLHCSRLPSYFRVEYLHFNTTCVGVFLAVSESLF